MALYISSKPSCPFCAALYISTPAREPNISIASCAVTVPFATPSTNSLKPSLALLPSLVHAATPFFMPDRIADAFAPDFSKFASIAIASSVEKPICLKLAALSLTEFASLLTSTPACCPATVSLSSVAAYSLAGMPALFMSRETS